MTDSSTGSRYPEIERWLRSFVRDGRVGDLIPSETELATRFGVSRMTARRAVQNLAAEGVVVRHPGAGTYIAPAPLHRHSGPLMSFTEEMRRRGLTASSVVLTAELRGGMPNELVALRLPAASRVVNLIRVRLADRIPMALESTVLPPDFASVLAADLVQGSLHALLAAMGRVPTVAACRISARPATSREATQLELKRNVPVLVEDRVIADEHRVPIERTTTVYDAKRYDIDAVFSLHGNVGIDETDEAEDLRTGI